jgi:chromosome segregation ATPase
MSTTRSFDQTLELYKTNLVEYKASGNTAYKTASDTAKVWLDDYIRTMQENADKSKEEIESFIENYGKSDEELASLKTDMSEIREKGPELQTLYETERNAIPPAEEVDYTMYYTKGAVLAGVIALVAVGSFI